MKRLNLNQRWPAAWAGIIAPALFVSVFSIEGWLRPGYNPFSTYVSALSLGARGWIQIVNFILLGVLLLLFTVVVRTEFSSGEASRGGPVLMAIMGILFIVSGPFIRILWELL